MGYYQLAFLKIKIKKLKIKIFLKKIKTYYFVFFFLYVHSRVKGGGIRTCDLCFIRRGL